MAFEIKIPIEDLQKKKLFLSTPMYGGACAGMYARSIADLEHCVRNTVSLFSCTICLMSR
jgi:hypothetical protein